MKLHEFTFNDGSRKKSKRVGRGTGSGHGKTSTRGGKGLTARSGAHNRWGYEGGQMPLMRRMPKRGFHNTKFQKYCYQIVNLCDLERVQTDVIDAQALRDAGVIKHADQPVKILANGDLTKKLTIIANAFSESAKQKIEAIGGKVEVKGLKA